MYPTRRRPQDNALTATDQQHPQGYQTISYPGYATWTSNNQFDTAQAHAAYANPPSHTRGGTYQTKQICHDYNTPAGCPLNQYCPRKHVQAHELPSNNQGAYRRISSLGQREYNEYQHRWHNETAKERYRSRSRSRTKERLPKAAQPSSKEHSQQADKPLTTSTHVGAQDIKDPRTLQ